MTAGNPDLRAHGGTHGRLDTLLRHYHGYLQALFELQREALLERDDQLAADFAGLHRQMLACHVETEERLLLPLLKELGSDVRWSSDVYLLEHRKIMQLADRLIAQLGGLDGKLTRTRSLRLLDDRHPLMHLLEHHEQREEEAMVVELQGGVIGSRLDEVVSDVARQWLTMERGQRQAIAACRRRLSG